MVSEVDRQIERSSEVLARSRDRYQSVATRSRKRREGEIMKRVGRTAAADAAIIVIATVIGFITPLGLFGALAVMALLIAATILFAVWPGEPMVRVEALPSAPLAALPGQTERWLEAQRPALPAPAQRLVDDIGVRLDTLAPQLATLDEREPAAAEVRKLVGEQLPELVRGYQRVPQPLRGQARNGVTPDAQLVEGLRVIESEIGEMTAQLAQGDLDQLATRQRFLQIKYQGDELP